MGLIVKNETWTLEEEILSPSYDKTLKTAGTFLDRNINIILKPKKGNVELSSTSKIEQKITVTNDDRYAIKATSTVTVTPNVANGWVDVVNGKDITDENIIYLNRTRLESGLVADESTLSGSSCYRVSATQGYNEEQLTKDIAVFQGDIEFGKES